MAKTKQQRNKNTFESFFYQEKEEQQVFRQHDHGDKLIFSMGLQIWDLDQRQKKALTHNGSLTVLTHIRA